MPSLRSSILVDASDILLESDYRHKTTLQVDQLRLVICLFRSIKRVGSSIIEEIKLNVMHVLFAQNIDFVPWTVQQ